MCYQDKIMFTMLCTATWVIGLTKTGKILQITCSMSMTWA